MRFLQTQVGRSVHISPTSLDAPFLDKCEGSVQWEIRDSTAPKIIDEINRGIAPGARRLSPIDLEMAHSNSISSGVAMCKGRFGELAMVRAPVIAPDRVVLLFEEQSLIELR